MPGVGWRVVKLEDVEGLQWQATELFGIRCDRRGH
jgi:hypothetical protein